MRMGINLWWLLVTVDHCSDADHEILYRQRPDTDARCPHREGTSLNERRPVVVSVTVDSAPVKWTREDSRRPPRDGAKQLHQTEHYRVISRAVKFRAGSNRSRARKMLVGGSERIASFIPARKFVEE